MLGFKVKNHTKIVIQSQTSWEYKKLALQHIALRHTRFRIQSQMTLFVCNSRIKFFAISKRLNSIKVNLSYLSIIIKVIHFRIRIMTKRPVGMLKNKIYRKILKVIYLSKQLSMINIIILFRIAKIIHKECLLKN